MIIVDDLGWRDVGAYGSELYQTPHVDQLAAEGMSFSNSYASSPLCTPTRASILTGQTVGRLRITTPEGHLTHLRFKSEAEESETGDPGLPMTNPQTANRLPLDSITLSKLLQDNGYATSFMGKWHLGYDPYIPENYGFDHVVGGRAFPGPPPPGFFGPWDPEVTNMPVVEGSPNTDDVIGDEAVRFIESKQDEPFFLALWFFNVHAPFQGKPELIEKYAPLTANTQYQQSAIMGAMVETIDQNVGKVTEVLARLGLDKDTVVIFSSDNGGNMYDRPEGVNPTNNHPLKAGKGNNYEGGSRVPFIVRWPNHIEPNTWNETVSISYDYFPTLLEVAGIEAPTDAVLDGVSLMPAFKGELMERPPVVSMFGHTVLATGNVANVWMRDGDFKLLRFFNTGPGQSDHFELYDLSVDPGEANNLAGHSAEKVAEMNAWLDQHLEETQTLLPRKNPLYDPDLIQSGFKMEQGGFFAGGANEENVTITSNQGSVTLTYTPKEGETGTHLELTAMTNCTVGATASIGGIYGQPVKLRPDLAPQQVHIPLGQTYVSGLITMVLDMSQPGRTHLSKISLVRPN
jgi:arylsulfatase A-like enzyme